MVTKHKPRDWGSCPLACHLFMDGTNYHGSLKKTTAPSLGFSKDLLNAPRITYTLSAARNEPKLVLRYPSTRTRLSTYLNANYGHFKISFSKKTKEFQRTMIRSYTLSEAWSGGSWADLMAAWGAFGTDCFDRSILRPKHRAYYRSGRPVIKIGLIKAPWTAMRSAPSLGQSIAADSHLYTYQ